MKTAAATPIRWVDLIRVLGTFLVVMAHLNYTAGVGTKVYYFYYALSRIAVPLFFLVSGYLLLSKEESLADFLKKRAWKVIFPLIVWSLVYMAFGGDFSRKDSIGDLIVNSLVKIIRSPRASHLWFLYALVGLYLATPVLRLFTSKATESELLYFVFVWVIAVPVTGFFEDYTRLRVGIEWNMFTGYIGYFVLGYYLGRREYTPLQLWTAACLFVLSFGFSWAAIYVAKQIDPYVDYFELYLSLNVILMAVTSFVLLSRINITEGWHRFLFPQSRASFGMYLIHPLVLGTMLNIFPFAAWYANPAALWVVPMLTLIGYVLSFILIFILQKVPFLKYVVP